MHNTPRLGFSLCSLEIQVAYLLPDSGIITVYAPNSSTAREASVLDVPHPERCVAVSAVLYPLTIMETNGGKTGDLCLHDIICLFIFNTEPLTITVDSIQIYAGQRHSFILAANKQVDNYWIHTIANGGATSFEPGWAILRSMGANHTDPTTKETTSTAPLVETDLHPFEKTAVSGKPVAIGADITMNLVISYNNTSKSTPFEINDFERRPMRHRSPPLRQRVHFTAKQRGGSVDSWWLARLTPSVSRPVTPIQHTFFMIRSAGSDTYNFHNPRPNNHSVCAANPRLSFVTGKAGPYRLSLPTCTYPILTPGTTSTSIFNRVLHWFS
ncbi:hypothetical protein DFH08DRAFT_801649 [Mycena albidolilacea]|uniref:Plastocyanin-like domain-containing protein n=1 Tax=Mycena albidolilacea TaxID=1033008 RepID=A0AAD7AIZ1_9AGAR|nr:hypothetical protein DFH08DRAFT_801649 [Mycena albidolilacea]